MIQQQQQTPTPVPASTPADSMAARTRADSPGFVARGFSMKSGTPSSTAAMIGATCSFSAVAMMGRAATGPIARVRLWVPPAAGSIPSFVSGRPSTVSGAARRMSHSSAISRPAARA